MNTHLSTSFPGKKKKPTSHTIRLIQFAQTHRITISFYLSFSSGRSMPPTIAVYWCAPLTNPCLKPSTYHRLISYNPLEPLEPLHDRHLDADAPAASFFSGKRVGPFGASERKCLSQKVQLPVTGDPSYSFGPGPNSQTEWQRGCQRETKSHKDEAGLPVARKASIGVLCDIGSLE